MSRVLLYVAAAVGGIVIFTIAWRLPSQNRAAEVGPDSSRVVESLPASQSEARTVVTLLRSASVQADLKLDARQTPAVNAAVAEIDQPLWRLRNASASDGEERLRTLRTKLDAALAATLSPAQRRRWEQLQWRAQGLRALRDGRFTDALELTPEQKGRWRDLLTQIEASKPDPAKLAETEKEAMAVLTDVQRRRLQELLGPAFDFSKVRQVAVKAPEIAGIEGWVNSSPLRLSELHGKVVVLHFWTFGCINCIHNLPIYKTWYDELPHDKVEIVGIHTPETAEEHQFARLQDAVKERGLKFPIAMDINGETWKAWGNSVWPSVYLIDRQGNVRYWWTGEMKWNGAAGDQWMRRKIEEQIAEKD
jgi:peroxiredoxin